MLPIDPGPGPAPVPAMFGQPAPIEDYLRRVRAAVLQGKNSASIAPPPEAVAAFPNLPLTALQGPLVPLHPGPLRHYRPPSFGLPRRTIPPYGERQPGSVGVGQQPFYDDNRARAFGNY